MKIEKRNDVHGNTTCDERMVAFLESTTDSYAVLQLKEMSFFDTPHEPSRSHPERDIE